MFSIVLRLIPALFLINLRPLTLAPEPEAAPSTESAPAPVAEPAELAPEPTSKPASAPAVTVSEPSKPSEPAAEPAASSPDTTLATSTNYALNLPTESLDDEAARRKKRAERFGTSTAANGEAESEDVKKAERAKKFGATESGLGKLNVALPSERERGAKRKQEGEDTAMDDPALIRRGGGGRARGGFRSRGNRNVGGSRGGRRQGTPDRPTGVQKPAAYSNDRDRAAADARKKRFAQAG